MRRNDGRPPLALGVTGTDTGVGKTIVAAALAAALTARGLRVGVLKPVETGVAPANDGGALPLPPDATLLRRAAGDIDELADGLSVDLRGATRAARGRRASRSARSTWRCSTRRSAA